MKALKTKNNTLICRYEDAIYFSDDSYSPISGNPELGYHVYEAHDVDELLTETPNGWTTLYPLWEAKNDHFLANAGETSWGGSGFIALRHLSDDTIVWVIHLSNMNNPQSISIDGEYVRVVTDLNFPNGVEFIVPLDDPKNFELKIKGQ